MYKELKLLSYCKNAKKWGSGRGGGGSGRGWGHQGGCVQRTEVIVKMQKKVGGGGPVGGVRSGESGRGGGRVRVDVHKELIEVIVKMQTKKSRGAGVRSGVGSWSGRGGGLQGWG